MSLARTLLLAAIHGYRRHVSPHKGFACAYRVHAGGCSCSTLGLRAISRYGAWRGLGVLRLRLEQCHRVARAHAPAPMRARRAQAGFVDCDVPCDASCADVCSIGDACEIVTCLDCGGIDDCGWPWWNRSPNPPVRRRRRRGDPPSTDAAPPGR